MAVLQAALAKIGAAGEGVTEAQTSAFAHELDISVREALILLLRQNIWPLRFCRNRDILSARAQIELLKLRVFIAGCGGLGGHLACLLARLGVGALTICDPDNFEESNLNRQRFCTEKTLGLPKTEVTRAGLLEIASYMDIKALPIGATPQNLPQLLNGVDLVADCLDSVPRKKMLENAAREQGVPYLHGSVLAQDGFIYMDVPGQARLEAIYPDIAAGAHTPGSSNVLAPTVASAAALMAMLVVNGLVLNKIPASPMLHLDCSGPWLEHYSC